MNASLSVAKRVLPALVVLFAASSALGQDRIQAMPGYSEYQQMLDKREGAITYGRLDCKWAADGKSFTATRKGELETFTIATGTWGKADRVKPTATGERAMPSRGRQFDSVATLDGQLSAVSKDRNVFIAPKGGTEYAVTTDGSAAFRIKYGVASWVYGEELEQIEAMWFSPDGKKLAYYRFDESKVPDYYVTLSHTTIQDRLDTEAYPKAGAPNPVADVLVYDLATKKTVPLDVRFGDPEMGHYVYNIRWSPDGGEILFFRENRKQNRMEMCAANPSTGACRTILKEENPNGWVPYRPGSDWTESGQVPLYLRGGQFIWVSERNGFRNAYLYDLTGKLLNPITRNLFDLQRLVKVDAKGDLWYLAHDGRFPSQLELHRVKLDGTGDVRLTEPSLSHAVSVSPTGEYFVDVAEALDVLPETRLCDASGKVMKLLASSDATAAGQIGLRSVERVSFLAADGVTKLYGYISKPAKFNPAKKYPLLVSVYGGPESSGANETYTEADALCDFGFVIAWFDGRGTFGRGRAFLNAVYRKLGVVDVDDQAAGVKHLASRPYIDAKRVGIYGGSYGGFMSALALLRYPNLFQAAAASSPVTDWRNYDSTYTERYMDLPSDNEAGYSAGSAMTYAKDKKGALLLYYGTSDNNVHPSNTIQLIAALDREGKNYELVLGPDLEHTGVNDMRMMEFFIEHLVLGK